MSQTASVKDILEFALDAAWQAGQITLGHFQTGVSAERKADNSPVTVADRAAESKLRQLIRARWPDHGLIGEEYGDDSRDSRYTWTVDPIDGTRAFISGVPLYSTLLALLDRGRPIVGVIHFPALKETVYAAQGNGCYWNGRRATVSAVDKLSQATLLTSGLDHFADQSRGEAWRRLVAATYTQRTWGDAYGYALVATGRAEVMIDPGMSLWDCGPLQVVMEEAGGTFTDWQGNATVHAGESIATNGVLYEEVMKLISASTDA
jgi:histidinol phosphatase-like enzyme (inositol monophosphatase family)